MAAAAAYKFFDTREDLRRARHAEPCSTLGVPRPDAACFLSDDREYWCIYRWCRTCASMQNFYYTKQQCIACSKRINAAYKAKIANSVKYCKHCRSQQPRYSNGVCKECQKRHNRERYAAGL